VGCSEGFTKAVGASPVLVWWEALLSLDEKRGRKQAGSTRYVNDMSHLGKDSGMDEAREQDQIQDRGDRRGLASGSPAKGWGILLG